MAVDRIRRVFSEREMESVTDDYVTMGYEVLARGETSIKLRENAGFGSAGGHILIFLLSIWWTFGLGNLLYALYKRYSGEKIVIKLQNEMEANQK
ncbi:hypothetical protein CR194_14175 [Salipaludibacillus keqinensis]|uniref:DUF8108 domain-containing protein n=1 Tax=Salipaludibacillus keqinensis TaxID=2045207 RepID=A0A323TDQ5_9BACI|nr:hypothetical protein [Salipaludibacillus keqinensis]PYZ92796.1 hypothetical protein CR194_14175 [Salipaludibacillus keqinensis]